MSQMCYNSREKSIVEIDYFFDELASFKFFLKSAQKRGVKVIILGTAYKHYYSVFKIFSEITPDIKYYLKEDISKQSYILKKINKDSVENILCVYGIDLEEESCIDQLQEYVQKNFEAVSQYGSTLINIDIANGRHLAQIKKLSKTMQKLIHNIKVNYTWDTYPTRFCLEHPCILNLCSENKCHLHKSILPRYIVLNKEGEVCPYNIKDKRFCITKIENNILEFNSCYYQSKKYLAYLNIQKLIYNNYLIRWPFYFFPLGGLVRYEAQQYKHIYK